MEVFCGLSYVVAYIPGSLRLIRAPQQSIPPKHRGRRIPMNDLERKRVWAVRKASTLSNLFLLSSVALKDLVGY